MRQLLLGLCSVALVLCNGSVAWAGDGLHRNTPQHDAVHTWVPVSGAFSGNIPLRHWDVHSSVQVSKDDLRAAYEASRDAYTKKLQKYAKCTAKEAEKAISAAHPGMKVSDVQLRNIRTNLVYIGYAEDDEDKYLVVVDAGNGKILLDRPLPTHHERVFGDHSVR